VREVRGRIRCASSDTETASGSIHRSETLRVGGVEHLPTELNLPLFLYLPRLRQTEVQRDVSRRPEVISLTGFTRIRRPEARERLAQTVAKEFWRLCFVGWSAYATTNRNGRGMRHIALVFPVGRPCCRVERCSERCARVPPEDVRKLPSSQDSVHDRVRIVQRCFAMSDWECPH